MLQRLLEWILGLDKGFLSREGEFSVQFNPKWPGQEFLDQVFRQPGWGAILWNLGLGLLILLLVVHVYRREGRGRAARISLAVLRTVLLAFVLLMLNRPVLTLSQSRTEPSVVAVLMDDSISMRVRDASTVRDAPAIARIEAMMQLVGGEDQKLIRDLARQHLVRFYQFNKDARSIDDLRPASREPQALADAAARIMPLLAKVEPIGQSTQVVASIRTVLEDLQGQRLAGIVLLTDGRATPAEQLGAAFESLKDYGVKIYPVPVGSEKVPTNITIDSIDVQDSAFKDDIVNLKAMIRATGYPQGHEIRVVVKNKKTGLPLKRADGQILEQVVRATGDGQAQEVELQFKAEKESAKEIKSELLDLVVEVLKQPGELDEEDNTRLTQIAILDSTISVLYCDGSPRWEYRYLTREMIRDKTIDIDPLLLSAETGFVQDSEPHKKPLARFPESAKELADYDVILFGDVDFRQFTDDQLQLVSDFVAKRGGGFGMVAGPRWSPQAFRNTAIEPILPVSIARVEPTPLPTVGTSIAQAWRPVVTKEGLASSIFRFFADKQQNEKYLKEELQPLFWYCRNVLVKPGVGEVYAEHPTDKGPDGRPAPLLVLGRFGAGRTLFSAYDDTWRWRFYTGETIFDTYWVQQLRYLARSRKLGQRKFTLTTLRPNYELGEQVRVNLRVLDPELLGQLPEQIGVDMVDAASGQVIRKENLLRQEGQSELYVASWAADAIGRFNIRLAALSAGTDAMELPMEVNVPRLELTQPMVDRVFLSRLASLTAGQLVEYADARRSLPGLIPSAAKIVPVDTSEPLWDAPLAMAIFVLLITLEWVLRKVFGML